MLLFVLGVLVAAWLGLAFYRRLSRLTPLARPTVEISARDLTGKSGASSPLFERLSASQTGIDFTCQIEEQDARRYLYETGFSGGGVAIGDFDNDGRPDVFLVSGPGLNRLYRQVADFRFEDVTEKAGVGGGDAWGAGAAMADVNNDGRLDIYVCNYDSPNQLFINQGDGTFVNEAYDYGLAVADASLMAAFADYDLDGDLDMYLLTNRYVPPNGRPATPPLTIVDGRPAILPEYRKYYDFTVGNFLDDRAGRSDALFRNNGDGTFTDVSEQAGLWGRFHGLSATWFDYNEDGYPDIYIANDFNGPDQLFRNDGNGTFADARETALPHMPWFSMGSDAADVNNDGHIDILVADMARTAHLARMTSSVPVRDEHILGAYRPDQTMWNALFLNFGVDHFQEVAHLAGLDSTNWTWAVKLADFDNDGRVDAFFTNGFTRDFADADQVVTPQMEIGHTVWDAGQGFVTLREQNLAFRNLGDVRFQDVSHHWGLDATGISMSAAYADIDRDGDLDLIVSNLNEPVAVYRNNASTGHSLLVRLEGGRSNRFGLGALLRAKTQAGEQVRWLSPMTGYNSTNEPLVHFGLGNETKVAELTVDWPSGQRQVFRDLKADTLFTIAEPDRPLPARTPRRKTPSWFARSPALVEAAHRERAFNELQQQPLLPHKFSQLGPGQAWADIDGDGDDDLYLGGAAGSAGTLWLNQGNDRFAPLPSDALSADLECEDMGAVWLDADGDGDLDLYVVSGGVEAGDDNRLLRDRLYWNDGHGLLTKAAADELPPLEDSGGPVCAADFDRDGDLDLFVGGRVVPGRYPATPASRLLRNEGGKFVDVTESIAPQLLRTGLVTSALWSDADNDGWPDLVVAHEWGPIKLYHNDAGRLADQTEAAGLSRFVGWWNGITGRDVDNDGDIDYVATNFGLNSKYHATAAAPFQMYYGDFSGLGRPYTVETEMENGTLYPMRDRFSVSRDNPLLTSRYRTEAAYGKATLADVYGDDLNQAQVFTVNTLESGVFVNDGLGHFEFRPLPRMAQASAGYGVALADYDADGNVDLYLVGNDHSRLPPNDRIDGGLSLLLRGDGHGNFTPVPPDDSGLVVPGDAKSLALTDFNGDGWPDVVIGVNDAPMMAFENRSSKRGHPFRVRLRGTSPNPTAVGARVRMHLDDGSTQTAELFAGDSYLAQSSAELSFAVPSGRQVAKVEVRWPGGQTSTATAELGQPVMTIAEPR